MCVYKIKTFWLVNCNQLDCFHPRNWWFWYWCLFGCSTCHNEEYTQKDNCWVSISFFAAILFFYWRTGHRYIKQLFLVLGTRLAQFKRCCSVVKCVLDGPLDTHIWPFSRTLGEEILHLYWIYCFWVPFSGKISHHFPTKPSFSPIFRIARLFENFLYQSISILTWPGAFGGPILLTRTKPDMI